MLLDREIVRKIGNTNQLKQWRYYSSKIFMWYNLLFISSLFIGVVLEYNFNFTATFFNKVSNYLNITTTPPQYSHVLDYFKTLLGKI